MTDSKVLLELAARCEAATIPTEELFREAYGAVFGNDPAHEYRQPSERGAQFLRLLQVEAWLCAAMMLVPEGWTRLTDNTGGREVVELYPPDHDEHDWQRDTCFIVASAATPALALCAASLRAIAQEQSK